MVRTNASYSSKATGSKVSNPKSLGSSSNSVASSSLANGPNSSYGPRNPVCSQPTPEWQKPIDGFFVIKSPSSSSNVNKITSDSNESSSNVKENVPPPGDKSVNAKENVSPPGDKSVRVNPRKAPAKNIAKARSSRVLSSSDED